MHKNLRNIFFLLSMIACALMLEDCANRGIGPQGGPKDETPPKVVKETPPSGTVNFTDKTIEILLDEYIQLNDAANQVLISPPQQKPPEVKGVGKKVFVRFDENLKDSTTYTIDFGSAIVDNNERNPLENYSISFSTGPVIDSLSISGILIDALTLNPVPSTYVGIHRNLADSALETEPFTRIARTDKYGHFLISNIHEGTYRLYALNDVSRDFLYQPGEGLAMYDSLIIPTVSMEGRSDTVYLSDSLVYTLDSLQLDSLPHDSLGRYVDSIASHTVPVYSPQDLLLKYFVEDKQRHYFVRCLRDKAHFIQLVFATAQDEMPVLFNILPDGVGEQDSIVADSTDVLVDTLLLLSSETVDTLNMAQLDSVVQENVNDSTMSANWLKDVFIQRSLLLDTITLWLPDSALIRQDTLVFGMTYMMSDSMFNLIPQTDTIRAIYRAPRLSEKAKAAQAKKKPSDPVLELKHNCRNGFDVYDSITIVTKTPVADFDASMLHLRLRVDTIYTPLQTSVLLADSSRMVFKIPYVWQPEASYQLLVDSAAFRDIYGVCNKEGKYDMTIKSMEEYSTLIIKMEHINYSTRVQLLDKKEHVLAELPISDEGARFEYLKPDEYYVRFYLDTNGDGCWTTGDWLNHRQPEEVFYFPNKLTLRANWDFEETISVDAKPLLEQKPADLRPKVDEKK